MRLRPLLAPVLLSSLIGVLTLHGAGSSDVALDQGAAGLWQKILKLQTTASLLHTTAHPDDEQSGMLTWASRGQGIRTGLLTINRGEAGDNAIGSELFDALGLIRTDELARSAAYYGLDAQYFTLVADYGYSKRLDEALEQWNREALIGDMVRAIRLFRPLVVISRWQGTERDGHGQHQAAGALTPEAVAAAGDPGRYPELAKDGLRPFRVRKLFLGGARENEEWHLRVDPGQYDPVLGESYQNIGRYGISLQRSQTGGRYAPSLGPAPLYYTRVAAGGDTPQREEGAFDGLETSVAGMYRLIGTPAPAGAEALLAAVEKEASAARAAFDVSTPAAVVPALARGLAATRKALDATTDPEVRFLLTVKARQFEGALGAALGITFSAVAQPAGTKEPSGRFAAFVPPVTLDPVTPGQEIEVRLAFASQLAGVSLEAARVTGPGDLDVAADSLIAAGAVEPNGPIAGTVPLTVPASAPPVRPYFTRDSLAESRYTVVDPRGVPHPHAPATFMAHVRYAVNGERVALTTPVMRRESNLPFGYEMRELEVLPDVAVEISPRVVIAPIDGTAHTRTVTAEVVAHAAKGAAGRVTLKAPAGWIVEPAGAPFSLDDAGARARVTFEVEVPAGARGQHTLTAVAETEGRTHSSGYQVIRHRDLPVRYLVREATTRAAAFEVSVRPELKVGYVMGVGDEVAAAVAALGAEVTLLEREDLASGDLGRFDTIITGTRAYAVRDDLRAHNRRLLDWVEAGGNMIVLYNTPEFIPSEFAPYPGELPRSAEEIAEQDAPIEILVPDHALFTTPNRIGSTDFDGWIEQRGSKFFTTWDDRYTPLVSSHDRGQDPQRGGWLTTTFGRGHWTYMAYALHRQVPFGVPGAYRILANLISLGSEGRTE